MAPIPVDPGTASAPCELASRPGCFGLTVKTVEEGLKNFLVDRAPHPDAIEGMGYTLGGIGRAPFVTISALIDACARKPNPIIGVRLRPDASSRSSSVALSAPSSSRPAGSDAVGQETTVSILHGKSSSAETPLSPDALSDFGDIPDTSNMARAAAPEGPANVDAVTAEAEWFVSGVDKEDIKGMTDEIMRRGEPGDFLVHDMVSAPEQFGLAVKSQDGMLNYIIEAAATDGQAGWHLQGETTWFPSIAGLIFHYSATGISGLRLRLLPEDVEQIKAAVRNNGAGVLVASVDPVSATARWYRGAASREELKIEAATMARDRVKGSFFVRPVASSAGVFAITMVTQQQKLANYKIISGGPGSGYYVKGAPATDKFPTIAALVLHYATVEHGLLGQQLALTPAEIAELRSRPKSPEATTPPTALSKATDTAYAEAELPSQSVAVPSIPAVTSTATAPDAGLEESPIFDFSAPGITAEEAKHGLVMLSTQRDHIQQILEAEQARLRELLASQSRGTTELHSEKLGLQKLQDERRQLTRDISAQQSMLASMAATKGKIERAVAAATQRLDDLTLKRTEVQRTIDSGTQVYTKLSSKHESVTEAATSANVELEQLRQQQEAAWSELDTARTQLATLQANRLAEIEKLNELENASASERSVYQGLVEAMPDLKITADTSRREHERLSAKLAAENRQLQAVRVSETEARQTDQLNLARGGAAAAIARAKELSRTRSEARTAALQEQVRLAQEAGIARAVADCSLSRSQSMNGREQSISDGKDGEDGFEFEPRPVPGASTDKFDFDFDRFENADVSGDADDFLCMLDTFANMAIPHERGDKQSTAGASNLEAANIEPPIEPKNSDENDGIVPQTSIGQLSEAQLEAVVLPTRRKSQLRDVGQLTEAQLTAALTPAQRTIKRTRPDWFPTSDRFTNLRKMWALKESANPQSQAQASSIEHKLSEEQNAIAAARRYNDKP